MESARKNIFNQIEEHTLISIKPISKLNLINKASNLFLKKKTITKLFYIKRVTLMQSLHPFNFQECKIYDLKSFREGCNFVNGSIIIEIVCNRFYGLISPTFTKDKIFNAHNITFTKKKLPILLFMGHRFYKQNTSMNKH